MPSPARSLTGPYPAPAGEQQFEIKDAGAHPRVQQIAQLCTSIFEVPLVVAAVASGPTNYIFIQQVSKAVANGPVQVQTPCTLQFWCQHPTQAAFEYPCRSYHYSVSCDSSCTFCCLQRFCSLMDFACALEHEPWQVGQSTHC